MSIETSGRAGMSSAPERPPSGTITGTPAGQTAQTGDTGGRAAADQAKQQTRAVAGEAKQHASELVQQTRTELREQVEQRSQQLSGSIRGLADQLRGLRTGQPQQDGSLQHYLVDAEQRLSSWATRLEQGGPDLVLRDVRRFARRRPGVFLLGSLGAGFAAGRMVRAGIAASQDDDHDSRRFDATSADRYVDPYEFRGASGLTDPYAATVPGRTGLADPAASSEAFA